MSDERVRVDKWLWAARFFKTRSLAAKAVAGGLVQVGGQRVKPARLVGKGEEVRIRTGNQEFVVHVLGLSEKRGSALVARALYEETESSRSAREARREERRLFGMDAFAPPAKPDKRDRRLIRRLTGKG